MLARLLSPKEYGLLGMVLVFSGFANYVADMGLGASIIQKTTLSDRHLNSVFWLNAATGLVLTVIFVLAAPLVASFYGEPQLYLLTVAIAPKLSRHSPPVWWRSCWRFAGGVSGAWSGNRLP